MICVFLMLGEPKGSTDSGSGEALDLTCSPWFTRRVVYLFHHNTSLDFFRHHC